MGATEDVAIVRLRPGDALAALVLSTEAQWNQNEADWQFFLVHGIVFGAMTPDAGLVATAALLPYTEGNAWISMVLVTASQRRRGLATRLVDACLDEAARQKCTCWLDATPAGAAVYGALGFTPAGTSQRMRFAGAKATPTPLPEGKFDELLARDFRAMGFGRGTLLQELHSRPNARIVAQDGAIALVRDGRTARHIGPLFAVDAVSAAQCVAAIVESDAGPFLLDANGDQRDFIDRLISAGWTAERPFQRMRFGRSNAMGTQPAFAGAGPEYG